MRRGEVVAETVRAARAVGATTVFASADVSPYAVARQRRLAAELDLRLVDGNYVVPAGEVAPDGQRPLPGVLAVPPRLVRGAVGGARPGSSTRSGCPTALEPGAVEPCVESTQAAVRGGETAGVERAAAWLREHLDGYGSGGHDAIAADATSRLSPYLHFGCISPRALAVARPGARAAMRSCASSAGGTSTPRSSSPGRETQVEDMRGRAATGGSTIPTGSPPGRKG